MYRSLIIGRGGGLENDRGASEVLYLHKGRAKEVLSMLKGVAQ